MKLQYPLIKKGILIFVGVSFCLVALYLLSIRIAFFQYSSLDLKQDYYAARHLLRHESIYSNTEFVNNHPPLAAVLFIPLSFLSYEVAGLIWTILSTILFAASGWLVFKELNIRLPIEYVLIFIGYGFCWYPFQANIALGQWSILIGFCIVLTWHSLRHGNEYLAGLSLGLACLLKLYPALLIIYLVAKRRWKALLVTIFVFLVGTFILGLLLGPQEILYYFSVIIPRDANQFSTFPANHSILGILGSFFADGNWIKPLYVSPIPVNILALAVSAVVVLILVILLYRTPDSSENNDILFTLLVISMNFISPVAWQHNLTILIIPISLLIMRIADRRMKTRNHFVLLFAALILLSLPDIQIGQYLMDLVSPNRLPWYLGLGFLFYNVGLLIVAWLLLQSIMPSHTLSIHPAIPMDNASSTEQKTSLP